MIRPLGIAATTLAMFFWDHSMPVRWVPDPRGSAVLTYEPDGFDCDFARPFNHCWTIGTKPPPEAGEGAPRGYDWRAHTTAPREPPALPQRAQRALADLCQTLRDASAAADRARKTGRKQDLIETQVKIVLARMQIETAMENER